MQFNHLSLPVTDVEEMTNFFEKFLESRVSFRSPQMSVLKKEKFDIVIEKRSGPILWPENMHIGFEIKTLNELKSIYEKFNQHNIKMLTGLISHERGSRFFCEGPEKLMIEVVTREDAVPMWEV